MTAYRDDLPQLSGDLFLTDGGLETTLVFNHGYELPQFAAFPLLKDKVGRERLRHYFGTYAAIARDHGVGFILEAVTWRASREWGAKLGYSPAELADANRQAIALLEEVRGEFETEQSRMVISGCLGSRGDGYSAAHRMTATEAEAYHTEQITTLGATSADMVSALTQTYADEAIGIVRAAESCGLPSVISFTVETDGALPSGQPLGDAIQQVDEATAGAPAYYMINCAHPIHLQSVVDTGEPWLERIRGLRANASTKSHAELDESETLDDGNPVELGQQYSGLKGLLKNLNVLGGCCGTDHRHVEAICMAFVTRS